MQEPQTSSGVHSFHHQPIEQYHFQVQNNDFTHSISHGTELSYQTYTQFDTRESTPATCNAIYISPSSASVSSNISPFSPQLHHSSDNNTYSSPFSCSSVVNDLMNSPWVLRNEIVGPECDIDHSVSSNRILKMASHMDLKQLLIACAETISSSEGKTPVSTIEALLCVLEKKVSVCGDPLQRLGAYMLEGLRARLLSSGSIIYKKLKCKEPTGSELMSYMQVLYEICPYYKFAYISSNIVIEEAMRNEKRIHIIDFQIAQGSQWVSFIQNISRRNGGRPFVRITGLDDYESAYARGGGLELVGHRLAQVADSCGVHFEFNSAAMSENEVELCNNLQIRNGEALAVSFPYVLHHIPDESVSTSNQRDRLLRLVKSWSPKVLTLVEQESNTNTTTFLQRFRETLDYYTAMFESIDAARSRDDKQRISAEEHCVAKDVVNIIASEGDDRVERHELFGKWRLRLTMAGFTQMRLSSSVGDNIRVMLREYSSNYRIAEGNGALNLAWKNRALVTASAWR